MFDWLRGITDKIDGNDTWESYVEKIRLKLYSILDICFTILDTWIQLHTSILADYNWFTIPYEIQLLHPCIWVQAIHTTKYNFNEPVTNYINAQHQNIFILDMHTVQLLDWTTSRRPVNWVFGYAYSTYWSGQPIWRTCKTLSLTEIV